MLKQNNIVTRGWLDYELLDSGEGKKLERLGNVVISRPETQALWHCGTPEAWDTATTRFETREGKGSWTNKVADWAITRDTLKMKLQLTNFKHVGIFPEQAANWDWVNGCMKNITEGGTNTFSALENSAYASDSSRSAYASDSSRSEKVFVPPSVLNLFGYTGAASIVAAQAGAIVTHVDASHQSLDWAHENARLSQIAEDCIRYIPEEALRFARRELKRGHRYDGIILDPPAFGRGAKGEVWKIEEDLPELIALTKELFKPQPGSFYLLNSYAAGYSATSLKQLVESVFGENLSGEYGELLLQESGTHRTIPTGVYVRFVR